MTTTKEKPHTGRVGALNTVQYMYRSLYGSALCASLVYGPVTTHLVALLALTPMAALGNARLTTWWSAIGWAQLGASSGGSAQFHALLLSIQRFCSASCPFAATVTEQRSRR